MPATRSTTAVSRRSPEFQDKIAQMRLPLAPLVRLTTGTTHPVFPSTLLNFWLLTSEQLDELAHFYHQRTPCVWTRHYPCPVADEWRSDASLEEKRRRIGRFIGLRGCESPVRLQSEEEIIEEVRNARARSDDDKMLMRKTRWY